jgi:hypothetical protein
MASSNDASCQPITSVIGLLAMSLQKNYRATSSCE